MKKETFKHCDDKGCCKFLGERLMLTGKGFSLMDVINFETGKTDFRGVIYKMTNKDKGLLLNYCPFCGGKPGTIHTTHKNETRKVKKR